MRIVPSVQFVKLQLSCEPKIILKLKVELTMKYCGNIFRIILVHAVCNVQTKFSIQSSSIESGALLRN